MAKYGLIGNPLGHSYSPRIHSLLGDYEYKLYPMPESDVSGFMANTDLDGFNVTIPYKTTVMPYLAEISDEVKRIGSVNTIVRTSDGKLHGYNTDYYGFSRMLDDPDSLRGKKAIVLGSGGASRTVRTVLQDIGCAPVVVISRSGENNYNNIDCHSDAAVIVNTTPVGMYPDVDASPVDLTIFHKPLLALDLIYNPAKTRFLLQAEALGIPCAGGLIMLVAQAQRASELFGCRKSGNDVVGEVARAVAREMRSIALIGMPGCGKTSISRRLAEISGRKFFDIDEMIEHEAGMTIPDIFTSKGETSFRALETRMLAIAAKESGAVIATGGGIVTIPNNRPILMQNCVTVLIERELSDLPDDSRPITQSRGVEEIYRERKPLYDMWSERVYQNIDIDETAQAIMDDFC